MGQFKIKVESPGILSFGFEFEFEFDISSWYDMQTCTDDSKYCCLVIPNTATRIKDLLVTCHIFIPLRGRHNERDGVSNNQPQDCLLNRLYRHRSKEASKLRVTGLCAGNSPVTGEFPAQMASNAKKVSIWWRHHVVSIAWPTPSITFVLSNTENTSPFLCYRSFMVSFWHYIYYIYI